MDLHPSPFNPEQMAWLRQFVDHRLDQHLAAPKTEEPEESRYHSVSDLRALIAERDADLRQRFGVDQPFPISSLRHEIRQWLDLTEADLQTTPNGTVPRWEAQLSNAMERWPDSPFARQPRRGHWIVKRKALPSAAQTTLRLAS
jgi:hypothetical protein